MSLTKLSLAGNKLIVPRYAGRVWGLWHRGWRRENRPPFLQCRGWWGWSRFHWLQKIWGLPSFYPCFVKLSKHVGRKNSVLGWTGEKMWIIPEMRNVYLYHRLRKVLWVSPFKEKVIYGLNKFRYTYSVSFFWKFCNINFANFCKKQKVSLNFFKLSRPSNTVQHKSLVGLCNWVTIPYPTLCS
jgi:hypothetical protein